jgi:twitching motility protein PilT
VFRVAGALIRRENGPVLDAAGLEALLLPALPDDLRATLTQQRRDVEMNLRGKAASFRFHVFHERGRLAGAVRVVPRRVHAVDELDFDPEAAETLTKLSAITRGLIVVTGPAGSGKTTTCAGLIETINRTRAERILTIEDPIEYEFAAKKSLFTQRAVGQDVPDYPYGLRAAFREDPDVLFAGDLRDLESLHLLLTLAETGHLVLTTLNVGTVSEAITRLVDSFPESQRAMIRSLLARTLTAVIAQRLLPRAQLVGRVPANEILIATPRVRQMIQDGHTDMSVAIEAGRATGLQTMDDAVARLYERGTITFDLAWSHLEDKNRIPRPDGTPPPAA